MQQTELNEKIEVLASFKQGALAPLLFRWNERIIRIESTSLKYSFKYGNVDFYCFCVNANNSTYKIVYNSAELSWILEEVCVG